MTINVRQAVEDAMTHFQGIKDLFGQQVHDIRLEEIELTEDEKYWLVTIGFTREIENNNERTKAFRDILPIPPLVDRQYKTLKVNAETGEVKAIKIRAL
jgi:hypothetical protein